MVCLRDVVAWSESIFHILLLALGDPACSHSLGSDREGTGGLGRWQAGHVSAVPWQPAGPSLFWGASGIASQARERMVPLCSELGWPQLGYSVQFWVPQGRH